MLYTRLGLLDARQVFDLANTPALRPRTALMQRLQLRRDCERATSVRRMGSTEVARWHRNMEGRCGRIRVDYNA